MVVRVRWLAGCGGDGYLPGQLLPLCQLRHQTSIVCPQGLQLNSEGILMQCRK